MEFHQSNVAASLPAASSLLEQRVSSISDYLRIRGMSPADAAHAAHGYVYSQMQAQSHFLAFMDCFYLIGVLTLIAAPIALMTRSFAIGSKSPGGH